MRIIIGWCLRDWRQCAGTMLSACLLLLSAGCATPPTAAPVAVVPTPAETTLNLIGEEVSADRVIYVWDRSSSPDELTAMVATSLSGLLAERGYKVMGNHPNVLVEVRSSAKLLDDFGGGKVYGGSVDIAVYGRAGGDDAFLMGSKTYPTGSPARGKREFDDGQARRTALEPLASPLSQWVHELCAAGGKGLTGTRFRAAQAFLELDREIARFEQARDGK
jgi:hypothetical protein